MFEFKERFRKSFFVDFLNRYYCPVTFVCYQYKLNYEKVIDKLLFYIYSDNKKVVNHWKTIKEYKNNFNITDQYVIAVIAYCVLEETGNEKKMVMAMFDIAMLFYFFDRDNEKNIYTHLQLFSNTGSKKAIYFLSHPKVGEGTFKKAVEIYYQYLLSWFAIRTKQERVINKKELDNYLFFVDNWLKEKDESMSQGIRETITKYFARCKAGNMSFGKIKALF